MTEVMKEKKQHRKKGNLKKNSGNAYYKISGEFGKQFVRIKYRHPVSNNSFVSLSSFEH